MTGNPRKSHSNTFKAKVALTAMRNDLTTAQICSQFAVAQTQVFNWKKQLAEGAARLFETNSLGVRRDEDALITPLLKEIGRLQMENVFFKKKCLL